MSQEWRSFGCKNYESMCFSQQPPLRSPKLLTKPTGQVKNSSLLCGAPLLS